MRPFARSFLAGASLALAVAATAPRAQAQGGVAGATVLQMPAGSRAAAFAGGYAAATGDADVLFYNPAGLSSLNAGAGFAVEPFVEGITFGSASGSVHVGQLAVGAGVSFLDGGSVDVIAPDPDFGGQRGSPTGETATATESAARLAAALPLAGGRVRVGAAAGFVSSAIAGSSAGAPLFDVGAQAGLLPDLTLGAALRNFGGNLGKDTAAAPLPTELRVGLGFHHVTPAGLGVAASADYVAGLEDHTSGFAGGLEAGFFPAGGRHLGAVARVGYAYAGTGALAPLQLGGGLSLGHIALDYTFQDLQYFGAVHRIGLRWTRPLH